MCLCGQPHFYLPADLVLSGTLEVLQAHLPGEVLFEGEGTPGLARTNVLGPHPQQDQIGYQGYCYRALDPGSVLGHLVLSHAYHFLPFLEEQFHRPASEVDGRRLMRGGLWQIGHQYFSVFGAVVTPPFAEHYGDISHLTQRSTFGKAPKDAFASSGTEQGNPHFAIGCPRQMPDQIPQAVTIGELPGPREGDNKPPVARLNRPQILTRGVGRVCYHNDFPTPPRQDQLVEHL